MMSMAKRTVLFLAANPCGTDPRALDQEAHSIRAELKRSGYRDRFQLETRWAVQPLDLLRELRELRPAVVHFSGQGGPDGLFFQAADGRAQVVSPEAIAETFGAAGASVQLVVLSACYGEAAAKALLAHVDCVVGMSGALHDQAARAFAIGFYGALGDHESVAAAYRHGNAAIRLEGLSEAERPQLKVRGGFDPAALIPAAAPPEVRLELPCPYPGMRPYTADDADHFHGRGAEIDELIGRLRAGERELCVLGPSGSGKSSLVAAGVLPRLARGVTGLGPFLVRSMRPGERPATRLGEVLELSHPARTPADAVAALLVQRAPGASVLIVIDQLEELFTLADPGERERFWLAWCALRAEPRCVVVFTLRADFHGAFMESPLWHRRLSYLSVGPLRGEALCEAIVHPARDVGVRLEPELVTQLLADAGSEPGVLPLLQETLGQLWDRRQGQTLTLADYRTLGEGERSGLAVALARRADAVLRPLPSAQEAIACRILLRLISFGEGRSDTRRQQSHTKLRAAGDDATDFDRVLHLLITARLLTVDDDEHGQEACVDLAHEVLITSWPTLAGWIQTHRGDEQRRRQLEAAATEWAKHGRGPRGLLDAIELADAEAWQRTECARGLGPSADVAALVAASWAALDQQRRRRRQVGGGFAALAVFAAVAAIFAVMARHRASYLSRFVLSLEPFDWDAEAQRATPVDPRPLGLDWHLQAWTDDGPGAPYALHEDFERTTPRRDGTALVENVEARGGRAYLTIRRRGCTPSLLPLKDLPAYAQREQPFPTLHVRVPTCAATAAGMIEIPAGPFRYGGSGTPPSRVAAQIAPEERIDLPRFWIDRTEVTNAAFAMLADMAVITGIEAPSYPHTAALEHAADPRKPVIGITWYTARDYCRYLGKDLPSSEQWVKAMRGGEKLPNGSDNPIPDRNYPFGIGDPYQLAALTKSPGTWDVATHPGDVSPYGVLDMTGNAEEWTLTAASRRGIRMLRGGGVMEPAGDALIDFMAIPNPRVASQLLFAIGERCVVNNGPAAAPPSGQG
jgi:hypothetical protein